jgi:glycosyltransferase involved in cell wall biosynthesis
MSHIPEASCTLVIPAYNEEHRIRHLFDTIDAFGGELIVVCDGNDNTEVVTGEIAKKRPDLAIRCIRFRRRLGKGGGVIEGLREARTPYVGYFDADGSTGIREMVRLFACLDTSDGAIGSRWVAGSVLQVRQGFMRRLQSRGFNLLIRIMFGLMYHDTQCGAKVFRKSAIEKVLPQMRTRGFEFDVEILWRMRTAGFHVIEVPIEWKNKGDSRVKSGDMIGMLSALLRLRLGLGGV